MCSGRRVGLLGFHRPGRLDLQKLQLAASLEVEGLVVRELSLRCFGLALLAACAAGACSDRGIDPTLTPDALWRPAQPDPPVVSLPPGIRVRAGSWNLHGGGEGTPAQVASFIAGLSLDVLALQESPPGYAAAIAEASEMKFVAEDDGRAIVSRYALSEITHVSLRNGRAFTRATASIEGALFAIYAVHIGWNVEGDLQARELIDEHLALDPVPHLLVAGDFNDEKYSSQNNILEEILADVWTALGLYPGERISWPSTAFDGSEGSQLIDLIFFRKTLPAIAVAGDVVNLSPVLSDHKPVWAELIYPRSTVPFSEDPFAVLRRLVLPSGENLLANPGAENGLDSWTLFGDPQAAASRGTQVSFQGGQFFTGYTSAAVGMRSSGSQLVDLSAHAEEIDRGFGALELSAMMTTAFNTIESATVTSNFVRPYDEGEIIVEALDAGGKSIARTTSKRRDTLAWHPYAETFPLPPSSRAARYTWMTHRKPTSGDSNDAAFDALFLGYRARDAATLLLGGNLLENFDAERGRLDGWTATRWRAGDSGAPLGLMLFPPQSYSGAGYFYLGGKETLEATAADDFAQTIALDAFESTLEEDLLAVRFGGRFRTWAATTSVVVSLELLEEDDKVWGSLVLPAFSAAEWTLLQGRAHIPKGAKKLRLVIAGADVPIGEAIFADDLFVLPERL